MQTNLTTSRPLEPASSPHGPGRLIREWLFFLILLAAALVAYQPALTGEALWDDDAHITKPELRSLNGLYRIWTSPGAAQQYYPLVHTFFWLQHRLWGDETTGYHVITILMHILAALMLLKVLRFLHVPGALPVAALFALHPVQAESVAWITELKNTLSGVFFFGAALAYLKFDHRRKKRLYAAAVVLFVLGLLSKTAIATLPVSLLAVFWWKRGKLGWTRDIVPLLPFFALGIAAGLFTASMERSVYGAHGNDFNFSLIERGLIAGRALWFYLGKIFWPADLVFFYPRWNVSQAVWWQYLFPVSALALAGFLWTLRRRSRAFLAAFICFAAALFPALGFFNIYPFRFSLVADHFQYLALPAPLAAAAAVVQWCLDRFKGKGVLFLKSMIAGALLVILGTLTWSQSRMYTDAETLYRSIIKKNPSSWMARTNLGIQLANSGRTGEAMAHCVKAVQIDSTLPECQNNLGLLLAITGDYDRAIVHYRKALELRHNNNAEVYNNLGNALFQIGETDEAAASYRNALKFDPYHAGAHNNLGNIHLHKGETEEAISLYRNALKIDHGYIESHNNLGMALQRTGKSDDALIHYRKALELNSGYIEAHYNIGILFSEAGLLDSAVSHYWTALRLNPDNLRAINMRANALLNKGRGDDALLFLKGLRDKAASSGYQEPAKELGASLDELANYINRYVAADR